jgi:hypothetical protein
MVNTLNNCDKGLTDRISYFTLLPGKETTTRFLRSCDLKRTKVVSNIQDFSQGLLCTIVRIP